mmetsp:Transcript_17794/g.59617  ORF Transcript_17794/g.59617 Transcript_17794/m.59617 type:complete len:241 (-) Transcript_17794:559-1281(-)
MVCVSTHSREHRLQKAALVVHWKRWIRQRRRHSKRGHPGAECHRIGRAEHKLAQELAFIVKLDVRRCSDVNGELHRHVVWAEKLERLACSVTVPAPRHGDPQPLRARCSVSSALHSGCNSHVRVGVRRMRLQCVHLLARNIARSEHALRCGRCHAHGGLASDPGRRCRSRSRAFAGLWRQPAAARVGVDAAADAAVRAGTLVGALAVTGARPFAALHGATRGRRYASLGLLLPPEAFAHR